MEPMQDVLVAAADQLETALGEWHCGDCGMQLGLVFADSRRTYVRASTNHHVSIKSLRMSAVCPACGSDQDFYSLPLSAVRLGLDIDWRTDG